MYILYQKILENANKIFHIDFNKKIWYNFIGGTFLRYNIPAVKFFKNIFCQLGEVIPHLFYFAFGPLHQAEIRHMVPTFRKIGANIGPLDWAKKFHIGRCGRKNRPTHSCSAGAQVSIMGGHAEHLFISILHKKIDITWHYRKTGPRDQ